MYSSGHSRRIRSYVRDTVSGLYWGAMLAVLLALVILGTIVGIGMVFAWWNNFPNEWEWVALGLGTVGLVMSTKPFLQEVFGQPKLTLSFNYAEVIVPKVSQEDMILQCEVRNDPIVKGILRLLGVRRLTVEDLIAELIITDAHSGVMIFSAVPMINTFTGIRSQRTVLPASDIPGTFGVAYFPKETGPVYPGLSGDDPILEAGTYKVAVSLKAAGLSILTKTALFTVQQRKPYAYWVNT